MENWNKSAEFDKIGPTMEEFLEPKQDYKKLSKKFTETLTSIPDDVLIKYTQQETLEEAAEKLADIPKHLKGQIYKWSAQDRLVYNMFIEGVKWQQERMYSEEDMRNAFDSAREFNSLDGVVDIHIVLPIGGDMSDLQPLHFTFEEWFEQFKKK